VLQQLNRGDPRPSGGPDGGVPQPCGGTGNRSVRAQPDLACHQLRPSSTQHRNNDLRHSVSRIDGRRQFASENAKKHVGCPDGQQGSCPVGRVSCTVRLQLALVRHRLAGALPATRISADEKKGSRPGEIRERAKETKKETIQICLELTKETVQGDTEPHPSMGSKPQHGKYTLVGEVDARK
jgi:hypothetical protein